MENPNYTEQEEANRASTPNTLNSADEIKARRREAPVEMNQFSPNKRREQFLKRPSMSAEEFSARKNSAWNINSANLSSFMKLHSIIEAPQQAWKYSSFREAKSTDSLQQERKISETILRRGMSNIHITR